MTDPKTAIPPEPEGVRRLLFADLEHHATALGYYCIQFSQLEFSLDRFIDELTGRNHNVARVITTFTGQFTNRCNFAKALLYAVDDIPNTDWRDSCEKLLNHCSGTLAAERNRLIHDPWFGPMQFNGQAKVGKLQAHEPKQLLPSATKSRTVADIWNAAASLTAPNAAFQLLDMAHHSYGHPELREHTPLQLERARKVIERLLQDGREANAPPPPPSQA